MLLLPRCLPETLPWLCLFSSCAGRTWLGGKQALIAQIEVQQRSTIGQSVSLLEDTDKCRYGQARIRVDTNGCRHGQALARARGQSAWLAHLKTQSRHGTWHLARLTFADQNHDSDDGEDNAGFSLRCSEFQMFGHAAKARCKVDVAASCTGCIA